MHSILKMEKKEKNQFKQDSKIKSEENKKEIKR